MPQFTPLSVPSTVEPLLSPNHPTVGGTIVVPDQVALRLARVISSSDIINIGHRTADP